MKLDLLSMLKMIEEEDKKLEENKLPLVQKEQKTALDLQGLFSLFEEIEPTLNVFREDETENLEGFKNVEMVLKVPRAHLTSKMGNRGTEDYKYFAQLIRGLTGGNPTPVAVFKKISELQEVLIQGRSELSISQNVSAMVLMEAIYSFFNGFYTIGADSDTEKEKKQKEGTRLGYFAESLAVALYGAVGTIPHLFANYTLYSLADLIDPVDNVPISLKTTKRLKNAGSKFFLLHDLVKYGKIYFDVFTKSRSGSDNIDNVTYKRHEIMLDSYNERTSDLERRCIKELKQVYASFNSLAERNSQETLQENDAKSFDGAWDRFQLIKIGLEVLKVPNKRNEYVEKYNEFFKVIEKAFQKWKSEGEGRTTLVDFYKAAYNVTRHPQIQRIKKESEDSKLQPEQILMDTIVKMQEYFGLKSYVSIARYLPPILRNGYTENTLLSTIEDTFREKVKRYGGNQNALPLKILWNSEGIQKRKEVEEMLLQYFPEKMKIYRLIDDDQDSNDTEQSEAEEKQRMLRIFKKQYPDQTAKLDSNILNRIKEVYEKYPMLGEISSNIDLPAATITVSLNLNPKYLKTIFQNGNDSLEKNYRDLVGKLNQVSELMNKYFLSPKQDGNVGGQLVSNAQEIPDIAEKAIEKTPATGAPKQADLFEPKD